MLNKKRINDRVNSNEENNFFRENPNAPSKKINQSLLLKVEKPYKKERIEPKTMQKPV